MTITDVIAVEAVDPVLTGGVPVVTVVLERVNPDESRGEVRLTMNYEVMDLLGSILAVYLHRPPPR